MSPTYIAVIILCGVALMACIAFVIQDIENKKRERNLRLISLKSGIRRASHLFDAFPPILMSTEIRTLLCKYLEARWTAVVELDPNESNKQQKAAFQAQAAILPEPVAHPSGSMTIFKSHTEAARAMGIIKELAQFIADIKNKGEINNEIADNLTKDAKHTYSRIEVDIELMNAMETEKSRGPEVVIHHYRSCFSKLQNLNYHQTLDRQLYEIRTHVGQLAEKIDTAAEEKAKEKAEEKDSGKKFNF
ncbi:hypothetical protein [Neptuniibacter sp. 1_MG-2023]|uniref:hypothetical protein n=1 Tax=Neptuniibacter sp. 1_MG-2023 TaxID=3062662 RepID=UPI0026E1231D|nr:hypothetical protein [Neptuniibacter sp. 1_MG-2023]MDO6592576.1 hypothetical protein [Neptuniibacter sp. 1_MG-2023]